MYNKQFVQIGDYYHRVISLTLVTVKIHEFII